MELLKEAIVCGRTNVPHDLTRTFKETGIQHWLVVSGSHLLFLSLWLQKILRWLFQKSDRRAALASYVTIILLYIYTLTAKESPPVFRAYIQFLIFLLIHNSQSYWPSHMTVLMAGLLSLLLKPQFFVSLSFYLSWMTSLVLACVETRSAVVKSTVIYIMLIPLLLPLQMAHPFSIFVNAGASLLLGEFLFPLSILGIPFPFLNPIIDQVWGFLLNVLSKLGNEMPPLPAYDLQWGAFIFIPIVLIHFLYAKYKHLKLKKEMRAP